MDVRDGLVKISGWMQSSGVTPRDLAQRLLDLGIATIIYTNIARDGVGGGADIDAARKIASMGLNVIASGGIHSIEDVRDVRAAGLAV